MNGSNWTGRTARNLSDAFGPHTSEQISDEQEPKWYDQPASLLIVAAIATLACWALVVSVFTFFKP